MERPNPTALQIERLIEKYKIEIDEKINKIISTYIEEEYRDEVRYILEGGKRLRGAIILLLNDILGGDREMALTAAVALEMVHAASLAIDDIIDVDLYRREKSSAWVTIGLGKTVLLTNIIIPKAIRLILPLGDYAVQRVIDTWANMSLGELLDSYGSNVNYEDVVRLKTSSLFELSFTLGALVSNRMDIIPSLRGLANDIGMLYQIIDDFIDTVDIEQKGARERISLEKYLSWLGLNREKAGDINYLYSKVKDVVQMYVTRIHSEASKLSDSNLSAIINCFPIYLLSRFEAKLSSH